MPEIGPSTLWPDRVILAGMLVFTFLVCCYPVRDCDIWWHIRTGQLIWERGEVPRTDWFSYTNADRPWIDLHWGFQLLVAQLYAIGGLSLIVLTKALFLTLAVAVGWHAAGRNLPGWLKAACWLLPIINICGRGEVRPEFISMLFLAVWLWVVMRLERQPWLIWVLPAVSVCWVNFQSLFVLGPVVGAAYALDWVARRIAQGRWGLDPAPHAPTARTLVYAALLTALACLINPYFAEGAGFPLIVYQKFSVAQDFYGAIGEFTQPITFFYEGNWKHATLLSEVTLWLATTGSFLWLGLQRRWSVLRLTLFALFSHLAWEASRNTGVFSLVSGVVLSANVAEALALGEMRFRLTRSFATSRIADITAAALICGLTGSVFTGHWERFIGEGKPLGLGEAEAWFAHGASRFAGRPGMPDRAYVSHFGQAAVYEFHNGPGRKVFMDPRLEVMTPETFADWQWIQEQMAVGNPLLLEALRDERGKLPAVVLDSRQSREQIEGLLHTPGWRLVFADQAAAVFLDEATADQLKLPAASPNPLKYPPGERLGVRPHP